MADKIHSTVVFGPHSEITVVSDSPSAIDKLQKDVPGSTGDDKVRNYGEDVLSSYPQRKKVVSSLSRSCYDETGKCHTEFKSNGKFSVLLLIGAGCALVGLFIIL
jgi:hypothetical protein